MATVFDYKPYILGGFIDAYYRAGMNALVNRVVLRQEAVNLKVNISVQVPARIAYIAGYKWVFANSGINNKILNSTATGLIMTPVSGLLESCNIYEQRIDAIKNARHGFFARGMREVAFAYSINTINNPIGVVFSAYFSHIPHILSTLKLANPDKSYNFLFKEYIAGNWRQIIMPAGGLLRTTQIVGSCVIINIISPHIYKKYLTIISV